MLDNVVKFVGEQNVMQVVTDNAAKFKATRDFFYAKKGIVVLDPICYPLH